MEEEHSIDQIKAMLQHDKEERKQRAIARIQKVLEEERCAMEPVMVIRGGTVVGRIDVAALD
jgi:hypothetical protein